MNATDEHAYEIQCATTTPHGPHQYLRLLNPPEERMQAQRYCHGTDQQQAVTDAVAHPAHYTRGSIEVIDFIEDQQLNYHRGNAIKYIARAGHKDPARELEDVSKAIWYLERDRERLSKEKS